MKRLPERFIVKVQLPVITNALKPMAFIYDEQRRIEQEMPITKPLCRAMGADFKRYFWAHMEGTILHIDERTDAPW